MKHTFKTILVAMMAVATVAFIGCSKEESNNDNSSANGGSNGGGNNTFEWIDLGLPSGLLWASCNVGATSPEGYGEYFAWGETATKDEYSWSTYRYCMVDGEGRFSMLIKYNTSINHGTVDSLTILEPGDDAATFNMGIGVHTPTYDEWLELINTTTAKWDTINGVYGKRYTSTNGNSIFLPATGYRSGLELYGAGTGGTYCSSSLDVDHPDGAWYFNTNWGYQGLNNGLGRRVGMPVRAVRAR